MTKFYMDVTSTKSDITIDISRDVSWVTRYMKSPQFQAFSNTVPFQNKGHAGRL